MSLFSRLRCSILLLLGTAIAAAAVPIERDLGGGLFYYRVANLPADLPAADPAVKRAQVLDLRYAEGDAGAPGPLTAWLKARATPRAPVFVLANAKTSSAILSLLAKHDPSQGVIVIGAETPGFAPDIALKVSPEIERKAYDALLLRPDTDWLLKDNPTKIRNDEARLSREHLPDFVASGSAADEPTPANGKEVAPHLPAHLVDVVLQRAVHLHRALLGLKRIQK